MCRGSELSAPGYRRKVRFRTKPQGKRFLSFDLKLDERTDSCIIKGDMNRGCQIGSSEAERMKNRLGIRLFLAGILAAVLAGCSGAEGKTNPSDSTIEEENGEQVEMPKQHSAWIIRLWMVYRRKRGTYAAMVLKDLDNPYWKAVKEGAEQAVEDINSSLGYTGEDQVRLTVDGVRAAEALEGRRRRFSD